MSNLTDAQTEAAFNGMGLNTLYLTDYGQFTGKPITETLVSATGYQVSAERASAVYIAVTTSAALEVQISPDDATWITISPSQASAIGLIHLTLPAGWYLKLTGTMADVAVTAVLS